MMDQYIPVWVALITTIPGVIAAILGYINKRSIAIAQRHIIEAKNKMDALEENTNSKMDKLIEVTGKAEFAKGLLEGKGKIDH